MLYFPPSELLTGNSICLASFKYNAGNNGTWSNKHLILYIYTQALVQRFFIGYYQIFAKPSADHAAIEISTRRTSNARPRDHDLSFRPECFRLFRQLSNLKRQSTDKRMVSITDPKSGSRNGTLLRLKWCCSSYSLSLICHRAHTQFLRICWHKTYNHVKHRRECSVTNSAQLLHDRCGWAHNW